MTEVNIMLVRRLPALVVIGAMPLLLANCSSDDPAPANNGGTGTTAGTSSGGAASGSGGDSGGTPSGGTAMAGSTAGGQGGSAVGGSGGTGGGAGGGGAGGGDAGGGGASTGGGGASGGSGGTGGGTGGTFKLTSAEITDGQPIPEAHTCDGGGGQMNWGVAPSFKWENPPAGTMSYAFFMIDWTLTMKAMPEVNGYHSGAWNIPTSITSLNKGWGAADLGSGAKLINGGYLGPCPPMGTDTYHMIVMALPMATYTISGTGTSGVRSAYEQLKAAALATAEVTGTYVKK